MILKILLLIFGTQLLACHTPKATRGQTQNTTCKTKGTVKDFTGLDGCKFMIVLADGKKLLPGKMVDPNFKFQDGQEINFDYKELKDYGMTICMAEDLIVEITCIEIAGAEKTANCVNTDSPERVDWMLAFIKKDKPFRIIKHAFQDGWLYHFQGGPRSNLYDCKGKLICTVPGKMMNDCYETIQLLGSGEIIWQGEGITD